MPLMRPEPSQPCRLAAPTDLWTLRSANIINSRYLHVVVLTQYKSHSLDRHIARTWRMSPLLSKYVAPVPAQQRRGPHWYLGSADAIYQTVNIIDDEKPDIVVIVGADHVYRMDFEQMVEAHVSSGAAFSIAGIRQPIRLAPRWALSTLTRTTRAACARSSKSPRIPSGLQTAQERSSPPWATTWRRRAHCSRLWPRTRREWAPSTTWVATSCRTLWNAASAVSTTSCTTTFPVPRIATANIGGVAVAIRGTGNVVVQEVVETALHRVPQAIWPPMSCLEPHSLRRPVLGQSLKSNALVVATSLPMEARTSPVAAASPMDCSSFEERAHRPLGGATVQCR